MSTPLHHDGAVGEDARSDYQLETSETDQIQDGSDGFAEAGTNFGYQHRSLLADDLQHSLDEARRRVEDLLTDVGVTPPAQEEIEQTVDAVVRQVPPDRTRPLQTLMPVGKEARDLKRCFDMCAGILAFVVSAPLMILISLALMLEGGPVFYRQKRVGRAYRRFSCIKFRTMRPDAEDRLNLLLACNDTARAEWRLHQKLANDPRVTPLGRLLRESSLDELPQLINVFRGEMSLVGPRPIVAPEVPGYDADRSYFGSAAFTDYAACLPGITGLWQVSGRHNTIYLDRVRLDRQYARTWSFWLDLKIIWKTVGVVLCRSGR